MITPRRWSREVARARVENYSTLVYTYRPTSLAEFLLDARRWADRPFIVQGELRLSTREFECAVRRVAGFLAAQGIGRRTSVMLLGHNSLEWLLVFWAVQCLGGVTVLGNAMWGNAQAQACAELAEPTLLITDRATASPRGPWLTTSFDEIGAALRNTTAAFPCPEPAPDMEDETAVIMFSSGTTGDAKAVVISHRSFIANIQNLLVLTGRLPDELAPEASGTISLLTMPLFHMGGIQIATTTLLTGGTLVMLEGRFDPVTVLRLIEQERVRVWGSVPTMVSRVVEHELFGNFDTTSLRSIPMGGAALSDDLRARIQKAFPSMQKRVGSLYGMTEAGGVLAAGSSAEIEGRPKGCVGRLLPLAEVRIDAPDDAGVGEIMVRTATMTRGYLRNPEPMTDPDGWFATGDRGWLDAEGYLYLVGRSKDIIIRAGENIACAQVEQCLLQHGDVVEAAVVPLPHADLGEEVGAVVVLRPGTTVTPERLRAHAAALLGRHEVPSRWWLRAEALPTNAAGKVAKREVLAQWRQAGSDLPHTD
ncbi:Long-chain-fatty-acid-CoA ligase [Cupriavidus necator]|uniref:class I adenylate-forming enzyme family protein n=1 Tax=Cupriavidus necator TaxID=106590 RepID=UPI003F73AA77